MIYPAIPINHAIYKAIVAAPAIGMDNSLGVNLAPVDGLQRGFGGIRGDFSVNACTTLEQTKGDCFVPCSAIALGTNGLGDKFGLIRFEVAPEGRMSRACLSHTDTDTLVAGVGAVKRQPSQFSGISRHHIRGKQPTNCQNLASLIVERW